MKKIFTFLFLLNIIYTAQAQNTFKTKVFRQYNTTEYYTYSFGSINTDDGGYILVGRSDSGYKTSSLYITKINKDGKLGFTKLIKARKYAQVSQAVIIKTNDGGFAITTSIDDTITLLKFNNKYSLTWSKKYYDNLYGGTGLGLVQAADGKYFITGAIYNKSLSIITSYLIKADVQGNVLFSKKYFGKSNGAIFDIKSAGDGNFVFLNYIENKDATDDSVFIVKIDGTGKTLWSKYYSSTNYLNYSYKLLVAKNHSIIVSGYGSLKTNSDYFYTLLKLDENGNFKWMKYNTDGQDDASLFEGVETADGGFTFAGYIYTDKSYSYLVKVNSSGDLVFGKTFRENGEIYPEFLGLMKTNDGAYLAVGDDDLEYIIAQKFDAQFNNCASAGSFGTLANYLNKVTDKTPPVKAGAAIADTATFVIIPGGTANYLCSNQKLIAGDEVANNAVPENEAAKPVISVYPNPVKTNINLHFNAALNGNVNITISSVDGKILKVLNNLSTDSKGNISVAASDLQSGIYFINVIGKNDKCVVKILKD